MSNSCWMIFSLILLLYPDQYGWAGHWRYWTTADGLREKWTGRVTISPLGNAWINAGSVDKISWSDGYNVKNFPSPGSFFLLGLFL